MGNRYKGAGKARKGDELFTTDLPWYQITPQLIYASGFSDKTLKSEYTRLRDIAQKRLKRMQGKEEAAFVLSQHPDGFPKMREMNMDVASINKGRKPGQREVQHAPDLVKALMDVRNFLTAERSSVSGIRESIEKTQASIEATTGVKIPKKQLGNYGRFVNQLKKELGIQTGKYESQYIAEVWSDLMNKGKITKKQLTEAIQKIAANEGIQNDKDPDSLKAARRAAHHISRFFDESRLDGRTRRKKK